MHEQVQAEEQRADEDVLDEEREFLADKKRVAEVRIVARREDGRSAGARAAGRGRGLTMQESRGAGSGSGGVETQASETHSSEATMWCQNTSKVCTYVLQERREKNRDIEK